MSNRMYYSEDSRMRAERERGILIIVAFSIGIGIGSLLMLLLATDNGEKLRELTEQRIHDMENQIRDLRNKAEDRFAQ